MKIIRYNDDGSALVQLTADEVEEWDAADARIEQTAARPAGMPLDCPLYCTAHNHEEMGG